MAAKAFLMATQSRRAMQEPDEADAKKAGARPITAADVRAPGASLKPLRRLAVADGRSGCGMRLAKRADAR